MLEGIREASTVIGEGISAYLSDGKKVATTVGVITAIAGGIYGARMASNIGFKYLTDKLVKVCVRLFVCVEVVMRCGCVEIRVVCACVHVHGYVLIQC